MKKALLIPAGLIVGCVALSAGRRPQTPPTGAARPALTQDLAPFQAMLNQYCITCHNQKARIPAGAPLFLDKANLKDPGGDPGLWEKVVRKLGVGAMPPQNSPTPGAEQLNRFRSALIASLDAAAAKQNNPGRYVLHRLNRTEYGNAIRDLLGVTIDVTELLPSDGGDFGFDNVATALKTSPLLLERYLTAALRISELAVGDPEIEPGTASFSIRMVFCIG